MSTTNVRVEGTKYEQEHLIAQSLDEYVFARENQTYRMAFVAVESRMSRRYGGFVVIATPRGRHGFGDDLRFLVVLLTTLFVLRGTRHDGCMDGWMYRLMCREVITGNLFFLLFILFVYCRWWVEWDSCTR